MPIYIIYDEKGSFQMLKNISGMRRRISALGLSANRSSRKTLYSQMQQVSGGKQNSGFKYDRFSSATSDSLKELGTSESLGDYRVKAAKSMLTLSKSCGNFDDIMKKNLSDEGVPENISFKFDYDVNSGEAKITEISDEKYLDGVRSALNKSMKKADLDSIANGSKILNGKMTEAYYSVVAEALEKCFGQDISELSVDRRGNILGMNRNMREAVTSELTNLRFNAKSQYGFPSKKLASVVKSVISDKSVGSNVSHMSFERGSLKTADGDISVGKNCSSLSMKDTSIVLRAAAAGDPGSLDLWVENEDLFK